MLHSPENLSTREQDFSEVLRPWVSDLMALHRIPEADQQKLIAHVDSLPTQVEIRETLLSDKSRDWKLGYLAAVFVVWKEKGQLPPEFSSFAEAIREHAKQSGLDS
jgi:hypothetical protein